MKRRPWILIVLAWAHIFSPVISFAINAALAQRSLTEYVSVFFQPHNLQGQWPHLFFPITAGVAIYLCKRWSFFLYLISIIALFILSYIGYVERGGAVPLAALIGIYFGNLLLVSYFLIPSIRKIYFDPRLRWWETENRYLWQNPATFAQDDGSTHSATIQNISRSGLLLKSNHLPPDQSKISLESQTDRALLILKGTVIHHSHQKHLGFGVRFDSHDHNLDQLIQDLHKQGHLIAGRLPTEEDSFSYWLRHLNTAGAWIPRFPKK